MRIGGQICSPTELRPPAPRVEATSAAHRISTIWLNSIRERCRPCCGKSMRTCWRWHWPARARNWSIESATKCRSERRASFVASCGELGPTRLSDVEGAQRAVAQIAARQLAERRQALATSHA